MKLEQLLLELRNQVEPVIGITGLSDPSENKADPLVQLTLNPLASLAKLYEQLGAFKDGFDVRSVDCICLDKLAGLIGEERRQERATKAVVVFSGVNGKVIAADTEFTDRYTGSWRTDTPIKIQAGLGFGTASSGAFDYFPLELNELQLTDPIDGVLAATNGVIIQEGYATETCEQFRARLLSKEFSVETEHGVLAHLNNIADRAWFINDAPDCVSPATNQAFVVVGGDDNDIANAIRQYAPMNFTKLAGNTAFTIGCEDVRFMRPCPVGIQIQYWGKSIDDQDFIEALCVHGMEGLNKIDCLQEARFRLVPSYSSANNCAGEPLTGKDCNGSVDLQRDDCPCDGSCPSGEYQSCPTLASWQYPVFVSAELMGESC